MSATDPDCPFPETADIHTSSDEYATRFAGPAGEWMLAVQEKITWRLLRGFAGATVLVTHDPLDALTLADELVFLDGGRVVQQGRPAEAIARPRTPYVAQVVGLNLYAGHALDGSTVHTAWGAVVAAPHEHRGESWVAFAPSAVALYPARPEGSPRNTWEVVVAGVEVSGQRARVRLQPLGMPGVSLASEVTVASVVALGLEPGVRAWATVKAAEVAAYPA